MNKKKTNSKQLPLNLLRSVLEFIARTGISEAEVRATFSECLRRNRKLALRAPSAPKDARPAEDVSAQVLRVWHRDGRYIDARELRPKPLHLLTGRSSLRALIKALDASVDAAAVAQQMKAAGLIRKTEKGKFLPTQSAVVLPSLHPWTVEHAVNSVMRLLGTVYRNANLKSGSSPLLERYSYVPDLDPTESQQFIEFARSQGQILLDVVDDWLEQRRVKKGGARQRGSHRGMPAGIHLITFVGEDSTAIQSDTKSNASPRGRGGERARKRVGRPNPNPPPSTPS